MSGGIGDRILDALDDAPQGNIFPSRDGTGEPDVSGQIALSPEAVVEAARPRTSPLHNSFEWDNRKAGEAYRILQAQVLIRSMKVTYARDRRGPKTVREYVCTSQAGASDRGVYRRTSEVLQDPMAYQILLGEFQRAIADLKQRYGHLREFHQLLQVASGRAGHGVMGCQAGLGVSSPAPLGVAGGVWLGRAGYGEARRGVAWRG